MRTRATAVSLRRMLEIHALQTGRLVGNETILRSQTPGSILRRRRPIEFPVYAFVIEHPDGLIAIDAGMTTRARCPRSQRRFVPSPVVDAHEEVGPVACARGLRPENVRTVIVTHLDWDHVGGIAHFPDAEVLVHRPEAAAAATLMGRWRYQTARWPEKLSPTLYDLDAGPFGPFPSSHRVAEGVTIVPLPGHSAGQVGVVVEAGDASLLFAADHVLREDWFLEDYAAGRRLGLGMFFPEDAVRTSENVHAFMHERPTVLLPSHDADVPARLAAWRQASPLRRSSSSADSLLTSPSSPIARSTGGALANWTSA